MRLKQVRPSMPGSWERTFLEAGVPCSLTHWRNDTSLAEALAESRLERAIGVIYRPETERFSHYFDARLSQQFDALVWFEETTAVDALPAPRDDSHDAPETWPFGV